MIESRPEFRRTRESLIGLVTREATRRVDRRNEHQLIGAFTKRPN